MIFTVTPRRPSCCNACGTDRFGGSWNTSTPASDRSCSSAGETTCSPDAGRRATAITRPPAARRSSTRRRAAAGTCRQRSRSSSGEPFVTSRRPPGPSTSTEVRRRWWSNGHTATRRYSASHCRWFAAAGARHRAASIGLAPVASVVVSVASNAHRSGCSSGRPAGPNVAARLMRPSVRVPVLSVNSTSTFPRSSTHTNRLTSTCREASRRLPAARLVVTTAGSSCGVIPTAIAKLNSTASMTGRASNRLITRISMVSTPATQASIRPNRRNPTWNSVCGVAVARPAAICPNWLCGPVATTTPVPEPAATTVPISAQHANSPTGTPSGTGSACFVTGAGSPVSTDSSQAIPSALNRRRSAGTTAPGRSRTTSPGTRSAASTWRSTASRRTTAR